MRLFWMITLALLAELAGLAYLILNYKANNSLLEYIVLHFFSCLLLTETILHKLPARYRNKNIQSRCFLFIMQFFMPFVGGIGLLFGIMMPIWIPRYNRQIPYYELSNAELPYRPHEVSTNSIYSQVGLHQILREAKSDEKRVKAVLAAKQMPKKKAIMILREALSDISDDVRLLAYACLDSYEKEITNKINSYHLELKRANKERELALKKLLAQSYWDMYYLGLASDSIQNHFLELSKSTLEEVFQTQKDGDSVKLYGRVLLALKSYDQSILSFYVALAKGIPRRQVLPYLSEALFLAGNYQQVIQLLTEYRNSKPEKDAFTPVINYWSPLRH